MDAVPRLLFLAVVACLLVHELDAIRRREWRFFVASLPVRDETAYRVFTALHAPLLVVVLWSVDAPIAQIGIDSFAVVHGLAHLALRDHPLLDFGSWFSRSWIGGAALLGALHLTLVV
ncbi:DUF6713 family protein [Salinirubrum litoreum]|uniref:DUF6713 family protein n=1 Tax=Salinirubrum litoreum TaxID=1126234 RepID=A0ABD5RA98_9EURY|nr:DUF6713 family protein [Salinirubrum litoreum]